MLRVMINILNGEYLTADAAAAYLGVTRSTLYAYVSRGLLVSEPGPGRSRARRYPRGALETFKLARGRGGGPTAGARASLHWGLPVTDSALTLIDSGRLYYRGHDACALATSDPFEDVSALLWTGTRGGEPFPVRTGRPPSGGMAESMGAMLVRSATETALTVSSPREVVLVRARRVVADLVHAAGGRGRGTLAKRLARGWATGRSADINAALVLCADHELTVSAVVARAAASADARLEHILLAAFSTLQGRRHGGQYLLVRELIADAERLGPERAIDRSLRSRGDVPGFGHRLYPDGDPRAHALVVRPQAARPDRVCARLVAVAKSGFGLRPNLDFGLVALARAIGAPPDAELALFAIGRSAGWIAHAFEAWDDGRLIRPRARYVGPPPGA
jgi:citrate synthase